MNLPAIDTGLMNEHLSTHEGLIEKLKLYLSTSDNETVNELVNIQQLMLNSHIRVMLELLNPQREQWVQLPSIGLNEKLHSLTYQPVSSQRTKGIILELQATATSMAKTNFTSALMMKNDNVKQVHFEMATQQATYKNFVDLYIKKMGWAISADVPKQEQQKIVNHFSHLLK